MASWVLAHPPWQTLARVRLPWDVLLRSGVWTSKQFLNTPTLTTETPAMREVKAYPYPQTALDTSLFEEATEDYREAAGATEAHSSLYPLQVVADPPSEMLKNLVKEARYADAARVRTELLDMGVDIPLHPAYHFAARHVLRDTTLSRQERLDGFLKWWSLFPPRTEVDGRRAISSVLTDLLRNDSIPDIPLISRFAILAASKGYAAYIPKVVPILARYASQRDLERFLQAFCDAAWDFETAAVRDGKSSSQDTDHLRTFQFPMIFNTAIGELAISRRTRVALEVLRLAHSRGVNVAPSVQSTLLYFLRLLSDDEGVSTVLSYMQHQTESGDSDDTVTFSHPSTTTHTPVRGPEGVDAVQDPTECPSDPMAVKTRALERSLSIGPAPSPRQLSKLIRHYVKLREFSLLSRLRTIAYRSDAAISNWSLAEMMNVSQKRPLLTIFSIFESHFHVVGVPLAMLDKLHKGDMPPTRYRPPIRYKLPPSGRHIRFIWGLFLDRATTRSQVKRLYAQFLQDVGASRDVSLHSVPSAKLLSLTPDDSDYPRPIPPPVLFGAEHFAMFMDAFQRVDLPEFATRVIMDMYALGIKPDAVAMQKLVASLTYLPKDQPPTTTLAFWARTIDKIHTASDALKAEAETFLYAAVVCRLLLDDREEDITPLVPAFKRISYRSGDNAVIDRILSEPIVAEALGS
ncbi:hypothetical protein C8Q77DRAFT_1062276 [Trametes polyzona]|nr:hypothetical protein C8Q77DRAFT_1062276 [Trametes polyzona]